MGMAIGDANNKTLKSMYLFQDLGVDATVSLLIVALLAIHSRLQYHQHRNDQWLDAIQNLKKQKSI